MAYHFEEITLDIGFSLTGLLPMHVLYSNFDTIKIVLSCHKAKLPIFNNRAHFNVTPLALNVVNVIGVT